MPRTLYVIVVPYRLVKPGKHNGIVQQPEPLRRLQLGRTFGCCHGDTLIAFEVQRG